MQSENGKADTRKFSVAGTVFQKWKLIIGLLVLS